MQYSEGERRMEWMEKWKLQQPAEIGAHSNHSACYCVSHSLPQEWKENREEEKEGAVAAFSLYNVLLLSPRRFNLVEAWSRHSSVLPLAPFFTPLCLHVQIHENKPSDMLRLWVWSVATALLSSASLQELHLQISEIKLTPIYSGIWKPDQDLSWQLSLRCYQNKMNVGVAEEGIWSSSLLTVGWFMLIWLLHSDVLWILSLLRNWGQMHIYAHTSTHAEHRKQNH